MPVETTLTWSFGGPLQGLAPVLAWSLLGGFGLLGAAWILLSYRRTLVELTPARRRVLTSLRLLLWLGLLLALAGPTRVERRFVEKTARPLAVLLDRSGSMTSPDNRGQRRADDALRRWRSLAPAALAAHGEPRLFAFADTPEPRAFDASSLLPEADLPALPGDQTRLFSSLRSLLHSAPPGGWGAIVALTDGLDTTAPDPETQLDHVARSALEAGTPLYLLPGRNRAVGGPRLLLRDLSLPSRAPPRSTVSLELTLESYQTAPRTIPIVLQIDGVDRAPESISLEAGRQARVWSTEINAERAGPMSLQLRVGEGADTVLARAELLVAKPDKTRVLYFQGGLDWGYRFLADILRRDPAFELVPVFNLAPPDADATHRTSPQLPASAPAGLPALPTTSAGYAPFDLVVLAQASASQITPAQQDALSSWTRAGGVVLFLAADEATTRGFSGGELERMLPVHFAPPVANAAIDAEVADFREAMRRAGGSNRPDEQSFAAQASRITRLPPLLSFVWEPTALARLGPEIARLVPRFAAHARVRRAKPGAEVLARHPTDIDPESGERSILLALQRYGRGQSAVLASDALWRWKLSQPSGERSVEIFWQNLLAWLGRERQRGLRFERAPLRAEQGRELTFRVLGAESGLQLSATPASGPTGGATPLFPTGEEGGARLFRWQPPHEGAWLIEARPADGEAPARHWLEVAPLATGEGSGLPPDEALLHALAERSGGSLLTEAPPASWLAAARAPARELLRESTEPLWHHSGLFFALVLIYITEMLLRRRWRLL
jgi:hypothetical protein